MKDKELKLNASGYYDEPCYKAITASPKPGEIWTHNQSGAYMLIVANVNGVCATLRLSEQEKEGCISVMCRVPMYANPIFIGYCFETNLSQFVKAAKNEQFTAVKQGIYDVLGLTNIVAAVPHDHINELEAKTITQGANISFLEKQVNLLRNARDELKAKYDKLMEERHGLKHELVAREKANDLLRESLAKVSQEAEAAGVYRNMYESLLDKMISLAVKRGGSVSD